MSEPNTASLGTLSRLPIELREMVYSKISGPTEVITPATSFQTALWGDQLLQPTAYDRAPVHASILATNKGIHEEARKMLYRDRIVRGGIRQLIACLHNASFRSLARRIEIDDYPHTFQHHPSAHTLLLQLRYLAQKPSITILSDKFAFPQHNGRQ
jgi:hypothetical protein